MLQSSGQEDFPHAGRHPVYVRPDAVPLDLELLSILRVDDRALSLVVLSDARLASLTRHVRFRSRIGIAIGFLFSKHII